MSDLLNIKIKITDMSKTALKMWQATHETFMEHDADLIPGILEDENKLNNLEKEITSDLVVLSKVTSDEKIKQHLIIFAEVVQDLELIGDYCKDILERVQIKIEEKLLFSEDAVQEYGVLYKKALDALNEITYALERDNFSLVKVVLKNEQHIDKLVDEYRKKHNERLMRGVCSPIACNMYLNMLDFTAAVYYHAKKIARNLLKIK
jgi:phosphate:Na+ symporter